MYVFANGRSHPSEERDNMWSVIIRAMSIQAKFHRQFFTVLALFTLFLAGVPQAAIGICLDFDGQAHYESMALVSGCAGEDHVESESELVVSLQAEAGFDRTIGACYSCVDIASGTLLVKTLTKAMPDIVVPTVTNYYLLPELEDSPIVGWSYGVDFPPTAQTNHYLGSNIILLI